MKTNDKNLYEPVDKQAYKKKYLLRKEQEVEAEQQIKEYSPEEEEEYEDRPSIRNPS